MFPSIYPLDISLAPWSIAGTIHRSFHCSLIDLSLICPLLLGSSLTPWFIPYSLIHLLYPDWSLASWSIAPSIAPYLSLFHCNIHRLKFTKQID
jgi:hypothetical protein